MECEVTAEAAAGYSTGEPETLLESLAKAPLGLDQKDKARPCSHKQPAVQCSKLQQAVQPVTPKSLVNTDSPPDLMN